MLRVTEEKIETLAVEVSKEDARIAIVQAARAALSGHSTYLIEDTAFVPQIVEGEYGDYTVYFKATEKPQLKAAG